MSTPDENDNLQQGLKEVLERFEERNRQRALTKTVDEEHRRELARKPMTI